MTPPLQISARAASQLTDSAGRWGKNSAYSVGLCQRRHIGLLPTGETHRQRLHRGVQQQATRGVPERSLVHGPCGCARKVGGLAQRLQRGQASQRDRIQRPDRPAYSRWRSQPAAVTEPQNSSLRRSRKRAHSKVGQTLHHSEGSSGGRSAPRADRQRASCP